MSPHSTDFPTHRFRLPTRSARQHVAFLLPVAVLLMFCESSLSAQGNDTTLVPTFTTSVSKQYFMKPTIVFRGGAPPVAGYLLDIDRDSLYLQTRGFTSGIAFSDILRLALPGRNVSGAMAVHAGLIGAYVLNLLTWQQDSHPAAYASIRNDETGMFFLSSIGYSLMTAGVAYLISNTADPDESNYILSGHEEPRSEVLDRLRSDVTSKPGSSSVHLSVQLSHVRPNEGERSARLLCEGGRTAGKGYPYYSFPYNNSSPSTFNLFRKGQLTIAAKPGLTLGGAFMNLAEPIFQESASTVEKGIGHAVALRTKAQGYFAVATYEPFHARWNGPFAWLIGGGLGAASVGGEIHASIRTGNYPYQTILDQKQSLEGSHFAATVFSDLRLYIYSSISLALNVEYVMVSPVAVDPVDDLYPSSTINMSSWSWGLVLGVHF